MVSKDIISPFAPKFPFFDVKNYIPESVKKNLEKLSKDMKIPKKKMTSTSSFLDFREEDTINEDASIKIDTFNEQSHENFSIFSKERLFFQGLKKKIEGKTFKRNMKKSHSFDYNFQIINIPRKSLELLIFSPQHNRKGNQTFLEASNRKSMDVDYIRKLSYIKNNHDTMIFMKNGKNKILKPISDEFDEFLDILKIKQCDKKLVSANQLPLRIRRKSACFDGEACKKLEKNSWFLTPREKKINKINLLIMQGRPEYAFDRVKNPDKLKLMKKSTFNQKIRKVLKNKNLENKQEIRIIQSKQDVIYLASEQSDRGILQKSTSLEIFKEKEGFKSELNKNRQRVNIFKKLYDETQRKETQNKRNFPKIKIFQQILKNKHDSNYHNNINDSDNDENNKNLKEAVNLTINNSASNGRIRRLFYSNDNSLETSNGSKVKMTDLPKKQNNKNYELSSYDLEGYKRFLIKKIRKEKKNKETEQNQGSLTNREL